LLTLPLNMFSLSLLTLSLSALAFPKVILALSLAYFSVSF